MQKKIDETLLQLYFRGIYDKDQLTIISRYLNDPEYEISLKEFMYSDWVKTLNENEQLPAVADGNYRQLLNIIEEAGYTTGEKKNKALLYSIFPGVWKVAAAAIIVIGLGIAWWSRINAEKEYGQWVSIHNEAGKKTFFYLPDSSKVYLGAASSIEYNKEYGITNRQLRLNGEAYFIVTHEGKHPFSVRTGKITTVDIGTEFNIRYLKNLPAIEVAVAKGSVEVFSDKQRLSVLKELQRLSFDTMTRKSSVDFITGKNTDIGSWRNGLLVFDKQSFGEVVQELERYYGLSISFSDPVVADMVITTTLNNITADEAFEIIALTAGVKIKRNGKQVLIE